MDKYEYRVSLNEINSLVEERRFDEAAEIADTIDWRKVKSADTLCRISDIYKICKDYDRARDILEIANQRNPHVPEIIYSLCELTILLYGRSGSQADLAKAIGLRQEYESECPDDPKRLILEYKFYKVSPVTMTEKIATLEKLRDEAPSARWEYELASLYHEDGQDELAQRTCSRIQNTYGGKFADRAAALLEEIGGPLAPEKEPEEAPAAAAPEREEAPGREPAEAVSREPEEDNDAVPEYRKMAAAPEDEAPVQRPVEREDEDRESSRYDRPAEEPVDTQNTSGIRRKPYQDPADHMRQDPEERDQQEQAAPENRWQRAADRGTAAEELTASAEPAAEEPKATEEQLSVGQVYDEWERIRRDIRQQNDQKRAQRIMQDTGPLLQDFDETARHGLIEAIEKDAARQRRQIRSGASRILGDGAGYGREDGYGRDEWSGRGRRYEDAYETRDRYDRRGYEEEPQDRYDDRGAYEEPEDRYDDRRGYADERETYPESRRTYNERRTYEPLPEPEEEYPQEREAIAAETVREEYTGEEDNGRGKINDRRSFGAAGAELAADAVETAAQGARRGSRFNAAVAGAAVNMAADTAAEIAEDEEDVATRRWNSDEIRRAMEQQKARIAQAQAEAEAEAARKAAEEEAARKAAEEQARLEAEEAARREAEEQARLEAEAKARAEAETRARIEAEIRAEYEAREKARIEEEERRRKAAEEEAARKAAEEQARLEAERKAREEEEAKARMYAEIEARIRAEFEERERARLAVLGGNAAAAIEEPATFAEETAAEEPVAEEPAMEEETTGASEVVENAYAAAPAEERVEELPAEEPEEALPAEAVEDMPEMENDAADDSADDGIPEEEEPAEEVPAEDYPDDREEEERSDRSDFAQEAPMVSPETADLPASAASSIAAAAEKAPSEEELRLFGPFYRMKENRDQVTAALDKISLASYTGNLVITGNAVTARRVAQGLLELTREADSNFTGKIAKATGTALNKLTEDKFKAILSKIENGALIIEHASTMEEPAVQWLYNELENKDRGVIVVMMDARKPLDAFLAEHHALVQSFTARVDIRPLNDRALVDYGKDYANSKDYALDELAELALSSRISGMQSPNHRVTLKEVRDIIDEAISYESRKTPGKLMAMFSNKRYDADDRIILHEKDFSHY